ncbi:flagellar basal body-associated FliL family protein [Roseomonas sp. NAR14]|uniref:Flagellar protein FliL n=1 Tax=Roseomonas acroporae TaxID=2937791 RepID=A0A9X1YDS0_9PROT|nr:flagellar basal body-associated FliL family protein [Roseomonas acroporae]MCK8786857.1 flagellar basal body-associated FliL family protein [Roseomonas acroporae]
MSAAAKTDAAKTEAGDGAAAKGGGRKRLLLIALPVLLLAAGAGAWFSGFLPNMLGMGHGEEHAAAEAPPAPRPPAFLDMPDIIANLNVPGRRPAYIKLRSKLELSRAEDAAAVQAAMPRLQDLFTTYLREMRPEELRGSAGTQRLREELRARANLAAGPARVNDVLFVEMLVQ